MVVSAYAAYAYALACVGYLLLTRGAGTPFADSLSDEQRAIKRASAAVRARAFRNAGLAAVALLAAWRPFERA